MTNTTSPIVSWLLSDNHWFNAEPRAVHLLPIPSWLQGVAKPYAAASHDPKAPLAVEFLTAELWMIFAPVVFYWIYSTWLYILSHLKLTMFEVHRIQTDQPARKPNKVTVQKVLFTVFLQHVVQSITALVLVVLTRPDNVVEWRMESPLVAIGKFFIATVLLDTYQYWMHRWMHVNRALYKRFHSVHHELTVPFAYGALYNHPVEGFLMDTVGGAIPSLILNMHPWTSAIFYSISTLKTVDDHCGYAWAWSPARLFNSNGAEYHDIHHWGKGVMYNFSQPYYTFWDHIMGTEYESAMERLRIKREAELGTTADKKEDKEDSGRAVRGDKSVKATESNTIKRVGSSGKAALRQRKVDHSSDDGGESATTSTSRASPVRSSQRLSEKAKSK
ncbi:hypothetical protein HDU99_010342 [Rhizoclosmatium hyalinum]|nr:hypothetical protein HDU99_010342 [Rhizoclosmatium hyalinum]